MKPAWQWIERSATFALNLDGVAWHGADDALEMAEQTEVSTQAPPDGDQPSVAVRPVAVILRRYSNCSIAPVDR
jgi:hypothetical protein